MSTPDPVIINLRFRAGDQYTTDTGCMLTRDAGGKWKTDLGLWVLSDQHMDGGGYVP